MSRKVGLFFIIWALIWGVLEAKPLNQDSAIWKEKIALDVLEESEKVILYQGKSYPTYQFYGQTYISLNTLEAMGVANKKEEGLTYWYLPSESIALPLTLIPAEQAIAYFNPLPLYVGNIRSYSLQCGAYTFIPIETLKALWQVSLQGDLYVVTWRYDNLEALYTLKENGITNLMDYPLRIDLIEIYWNGQQFLYKQLPTFVIAPHSTLEKETFSKPLLEGERLVTRIVIKLNGLTFQEEKEFYGQTSERLFKAYTYLSEVKHLKELFKPYIVKGTLKYSIGMLKEGEKVPVWRTEKRNYYVVLDEKGEKRILPWNSLVIEPDSGTLSSKPTPQEIQAYVKLNKLQSGTPYLLWTDLRRQRTYVLKKKEEGWELIKNFICSSGKNSYPTPRGIFKVEYSIPYIGMDKGYRCKNAMVFFRDYMYHSVLFDREGRYIIRGLYELGHRASHGCIRLSEEDSAWIYHNVPLGTTVWID
ncbi:hypothetical protein CS063_05065 [Sporanaerobium hydrogeniformans]|uniref:Uncharacterized protein n=1 Tax=Sporanaerobium hydrogeniformans TaxID=3072179 RepID=A0AC61DFD6_9FIRM|nr:L,D-transpeptidase [Sporanaerobium hydrogeniformans]PHV71421.1 hypothetical protein CS063_05065 [Sporanaerobium hydrogeniformans]